MARENHQFSFESSVLLKSTSLQVLINNGANITVKMLKQSFETLVVSNLLSIPKFLTLEKPYEIFSKNEE